LPVPSHVPSHPQTAAKVRGFSPIASGFTAETDWLLEEAGFEPSVPRETTSFQRRLMSLLLGSTARKSQREREPTREDAGRIPRNRWFRILFPPPANLVRTFAARRAVVGRDCVPALCAVSPPTPVSRLPGSWADTLSPARLQQEPG